LTDDGKPLFAAPHPVAPWYKRLWFNLRRPKINQGSLTTIEIKTKEKSK
jgi:hypothetical protein